MEYNILNFCCRTLFNNNELVIPTSWGDDIFIIYIEADNVPSTTLVYQICEMDFHFRRKLPNFVYKGFIYIYII